MADRKIPTESPFGPAFLVVDSSAETQARQHDTEKLSRALNELGIGHTLHLAQTGPDATALASSALEQGYGFVVAVGDDQTIRRVCEGMIDRADPGQPIPVLGVLAESSDLARSFNLPGDLEGAVRHLRGDNTYALDAMKVTVRGAQGAQQTTIAANVLEVGMAAKRTRLDAERRRRLGNAAAFVHFWSAYLTEGPRSVRIQADRREWEGRAFQVIVGNGQFLHGLRVSPRSFPGDRVLDALVYHGPRSDAYRILPRLYRHGDHLPSDTITELRAKIGFRIEANRPMPVSADGAWIGATPVSIQVVPEAVRLKL